MENTSNILKTALYDAHVAAGGKIVPFAGYYLPIQYEKSGLITEHMAVREQAGLFDVSHMGEITFKGPDALANIQNLLTNDYADLQDGFVRYSPMCYENGGVVDDLLVYKIQDEHYLIVVNASNRHKDYEWMKKNQFGDLEIKDISDDIAQIALQGPAAEAIIKKIVKEDIIPMKNYTFTENVDFLGKTILLSRTGYTGEDGFELYMPNADAMFVWNALMEAGADAGLIPCGLGARDTLRMESAMPLYGHEMDENITPWETGLGFFVKMAKDSFIGKEAIEEKGRKRARVGLNIVGRGIAREECEVYTGGQKIGAVTSGTHCP